MKHRRFISALLIYSFVSTNLFCQDIAGLWKGKMYYEEEGRDTIAVYFDISKEAKTDRYSGIIVCMNANPESVYWYGSSYFTGVYRQSGKKYLFEELGIIESTTQVLTDDYKLSYNPETDELRGIVLSDPRNPGMIFSNRRKIELSRTVEASPPMKRNTE